MIEELKGRTWYTIKIGENSVAHDPISFPLIISTRPKDLYAACSPKHLWKSSLTFVPGEPIPYDPHGAEETLAGYIRLKTAVVFIPISKNLNPPWHARMFLHTADEYGVRTMYYDTVSIYVPQPAYSYNKVFSDFLTDCVNYLLYNVYSSRNREMRMCGERYKGIYIDVPMAHGLKLDDMDEIKERWQGFHGFHGDKSG